MSEELENLKKKNAELEEKVRQLTHTPEGEPMPMREKNFSLCCSTNCHYLALGFDDKKRLVYRCVKFFGEILQPRRPDGGIFASARCKIEDCILSHIRGGFPWFKSWKEEGK